MKTLTVKTLGIISVAALVIAAQAHASPPVAGTLLEVVSRGLVIERGIPEMPQPKEYETLLGMDGAETSGAPFVSNARVPFQGPLTYAFTSDGKYTATLGKDVTTGTWSVRGKALCTESPGLKHCMELPPGKKSGDRFVMSSSLLGNAVVARIK